MTFVWMVTFRAAAVFFLFVGISVFGTNDDLPSQVSMFGMFVVFAWFLWWVGNKWKRRARRLEAVSRFWKIKREMSHEKGEITGQPLEDGFEKTRDEFEVLPIEEYYTPFGENSIREWTAYGFEKKEPSIPYKPMFDIEYLERECVIKDFEICPVAYKFVGNDVVEIMAWCFAENDMHMYLSDRIISTRHIATRQQIRNVSSYLHREMPELEV